jgi:predicted ATPase/DNA-binding SARP family transcriptional activator/tetratricopeptide (TPR) repeat protein
VTLALTFLDGVRWRGEQVVGDRPQALLAALASAGRVVRAEQLVAEIWGDDVPANPGKALQVLVSRTRTACAAEAVARDGDGYRLGIAASAVDSSRLAELAGAARVSFERDPATAVRQAREALDLGSDLIAAGDAVGPLADLRRDAADDLRTASVAMARALSRLGEHAEALRGLEAAWDQHPDDESVLEDLLRSEAAVRGAAAALDRFEQHRRLLRDRLGTDPGAELQRLQVELLAADSPVREGVRFEATSLLGRESDIRRLHALLGTSRVVSILGPGGLGKTRLAHVLGREATQPVVHFVELVGVTAPADLIGEVGSALGVRDSVSGRRALTAQQRADVRARIAQHLDQSPSLLILDNCEHIVAAVADLVAYLVATTRTLRVLTTTRSPLAIAAETVYPLGELSTGDAVELFRQRAVAARRDVQLDTEDNRAGVVDIVQRLDGLPLAIELAAAKVRAMSIADIARRLENRFALLRGGDRSAPDRHQTLLAVIDWSWNLLGETERHALRWLSTFHDGFSLDGAEAVLGPVAIDAVQDLADQSLLTVVEAENGIRFRMLETVREFGRMQLVDSDEDAAAQEAHRRWAIDLCARYGPALFGPDQFEAVDALRTEDSNLADVLRQAILAEDPATVVQLLAALGCFWSILGDHARVIVLIEAVTKVVDGWTPPPELADQTRVAVVMTLQNAMIGAAYQSDPLREFLRELGPGHSDSRVAATVTIQLSFDPHRLDDFLATMEKLSRSEDRSLALMAEQMRSHALENAGEPEAALVAAENALALVEDDDGPWVRAILHTQIAQLLIQRGDGDSASKHARQALPTLERLRAMDDALQLRSMLVLAAVGTGDLDRAALELERLSSIDDSEALFGGQLVLGLGESELALALGDVDRALDLYVDSIERVRAIKFPGVESTGCEPWVTFGYSTALAAHAVYGEGRHLAAGEVIYADARRCMAGILDPDYPHLDYPVCGLLLFATGLWGLVRDVLPAEDAVRLLVLAHRFAYNRTVPTMAWDRIEPVVEARAPGVLAAIEAEYGELRGPELISEARTFVASLEG